MKNGTFIIMWIQPRYIIINKNIITEYHKISEFVLYKKNIPVIVQQPVTDHREQNCRNKTTTARIYYFD